MDATFDEGYISRFEKNFHIMLTANNKNDLPFRGVSVLHKIMKRLSIRTL